jgi:hypothetical protein
MPSWEPPSLMIDRQLLYTMLRYADSVIWWIAFLPSIPSIYTLLVAFTELHCTERREGTPCEVAQAIVKHGDDVNVRVPGGKTPLHTASAAGHLDTAQWLLLHVAEVNAQDDERRNPLHVLVYEVCLEISTQSLPWIDRSCSAVVEVCYRCRREGWNWAGLQTKSRRRGDIKMF